MARSLKKGPFVSSPLLDSVKQRNNANTKQVITTRSRASTIIPRIVGHYIAIHNGNRHVSVFITDRIVGHKLGEFSATRISPQTRKSNRKQRILHYGTKSSSDWNPPGKNSAFVFVLVCPKKSLSPFSLRRSIYSQAYFSNEF